MDIARHENGKSTKRKGGKLMKASDYCLPPIPENERIYFNVPYMAKGLAKVTNCGFDSSKKLWFTGCHNSYLYVLVNKYTINENTSENAKRLLDETLKKRNSK